jgi:chromosome segregation ATPase
VSELTEVRERLAALEQAVKDLPGRLGDQQLAADQQTRQLVNFNAERLRELNDAVVKTTQSVDAVWRKAVLREELNDRLDELEGETDENVVELAKRVGHLETDTAALRRRVDRMLWVAGASALTGGLAGSQAERVLPAIAAVLWGG